MSQHDPAFERPGHPPVAPILVFAALFVGGLFIVKWHPYYDRSVVAAAQHRIGTSILGHAASVGLRAGVAYAAVYLEAIWKALVLALALGAAVQVLVPRRWLVSLFAGRRARMRATATALPSMMCTCCAAPITVGLIESGASVPAALAWWLANPVLNPATVLFIGFVLGWEWAAFRLMLGTAMVLVLSRAAALFLQRNAVAHGSGAAIPHPLAANLAVAWMRAFVRLAVRLVPEYVVLVCLLGAVRFWLFPALDPVIGHAAWIGPFFALVGTLFVIPTAGEVPIIQALQQAGLGTAGAAALLVTLPAVSVPSLVMLGRVVPARALLIIGAGTFVFGVLAAVLASALHLA